MNKRVFLVVASALFFACFGLVAPMAQVPTPASQAPTARPAPPAAPVPAVVATPQTKPSQPPPPAVAPVPATRPAPGEAPFSNNVRIDVTITDQGAGAPIKKVMSVTAMAGMRGSSSVRSGVNVPAPSTTLGALAAGGVNTIPITSYSYRQLGLSLDVRDIVVRGDFIHLILSVEYSPVDETDQAVKPSSGLIAFSNFTQSFDLLLENGRPIVAAQTSDPVPNRNRTLSVEVKATILK